MPWVLAFFLGVARAANVEACDVALDLPEAVPGVGPGGVQTWTWPGASSDELVSLWCLPLEAVAEPGQAKGYLNFNVDFLSGALSATVVSRDLSDWSGHPSVLAVLDGPSVDVRVRYVLLGPSLVALMYTAPNGAVTRPEVSAGFASLRVLREPTALPPSQVPLVWSTWTGGGLQAEVAGAQAAPQTLPSDLAGRAIPFEVVTWRNPGHGSFGVRWTELPTDLHPTLDELVAMQTGPMQLRDGGSRPVQVAGGEGVEAWGVMGSMAASGVWRARVRVVRVGQRVLIGVVHGRDGELNEADAARFLDSLRLR